MACGSHCPIDFHFVIGCFNGAAVGADDLWYHTGQSWVYVSTCLRFYVSTFLRCSVPSRDPSVGPPDPSDGPPDPSEVPPDPLNDLPYPSDAPQDPSVSPTDTQEAF